MTKFWSQIFSKGLPLWFRVINSFILLPTMFWPFVFYITAFFFDAPGKEVYALFLFIACNAYPLYLLLIAYLNVQLFKRSKFIGSLLPLCILSLLIYATVSYINTTQSIIAQGRIRDQERESKGYIGGTDDFKKLNNKVYYKDTLLIGADAKTFEVLSWDWERDKNYYYRFGKKVLSIDRNSFQFLDYHYAKDKFHVYYDENIIEGADAKTFVHLEGTQDGKDKNNCYRWGEKVDCKVLEKPY